MRTTTRARRAAVLAVTMGFAVGAAIFLSGVQPASATEGGPGVVIQLGDSFASGEGGGWKGNSLSRSGNRSGTDMAAYQPSGSTGWEYDPEWRVYHERSWWDECHAARDAAMTYPADDLAGVTKVYNLACSGAKNRNIWPVANGGEPFKGRVPQLTELDGMLSASDDVKLVIIGVGGNDAGFGDAVGACIGAWAKTYPGGSFGYSDQHCNDEVRDDIYPRAVDIYYNLTKTVDLVRQTLAANGQAAGTYRMVLTGYPSILPTDTTDWIASEADGFAVRCPVRKADSAWINDYYVRHLNGSVKAAAEEKGIGFIDLSDAFDGHRLCEAGTVRGTAASASSQDAEWVRMLDAHPNPIDLFDLLLDLDYFPLEVDPAEVHDLANPFRHVSESLHPNYWGQQAIGTCLARWATNTTGNPRMKCTNGPTGLATDMVLTTLPVTHTVVDDPNPDLTIPHPSGCCQPIDPNDPEPQPVPLLVPLVRTVTVPASVPAGRFYMPALDLTHPKKGQLKIELVQPNGTVRKLRDFNLADGGAWYDGRWTYQSTIDPSGTWTLRISDWGEGGVGQLHDWDIKFY